METAAKYEVVAPILNLEDVKKYIAPNASDKELFMFMNISKSYGLHPFKREVHFIKYGTSPGQVIVGYELYLKRAEATGQLDGWSVVVLHKSQDTERAQITIHRKDRAHPFIWEVYRSEFDKQQSVWKQMPQFMLKKVAIAQGFRLRGVGRRFMSYVGAYTTHFQSYRHDVSDKARQYAYGLMQAGSRKSMDRMAEVVPESKSRNLQQFLTHSKWEHRDVIDHVAQDVDRLLGDDRKAGLLIDERVCQAGKEIGWCFPAVVGPTWQGGQWSGSGVWRPG